MHARPEYGVVFSEARSLVPHGANYDFMQQKACIAMARLSLSLSLSLSLPFSLSLSLASSSSMGYSSPCRDAEARPRALRESSARVCHGGPKYHSYALPVPTGRVYSSVIAAAYLSLSLSLPLCLHNQPLSLSFSLFSFGSVHPTRPQSVSFEENIGPLLTKKRRIPPHVHSIYTGMGISFSKPHKHFE